MNAEKKEKQKKQPEEHATHETENMVTTDRDEVVDEQAVCTKAPEWAEHSRLGDDDEPCDDGRSGRLKE